MSGRASRRDRSQSPESSRYDSTRSRSREESQRYEARRSRSPNESYRSNPSSHESTNRYQGSGREGRESRDPQSCRSSSFTGSQNRSLSSELPDSIDVPPHGWAIKSKTLDVRNPNGTPITIRTNHFRVQSLPGKNVRLYRYTLQFKIPLSSQRKGTEVATKQQIARVYLKMCASDIFGTDFMFDNVSQGYSARELMPAQSTRTTLFDMPGHTADKPNQVAVSVHAEGKIEFQELVDWLHCGNVGLNPSNPKVFHQLRALMTIFRDYPANKKGWITRPNSSAFFERTKELTFSLPSTGGILEAIHGLFQSISVCFGGNLCINVDNACGAFYTPGLSLYQVACTFAGIRPGKEIDSEIILKRFKNGCDKLIGCFFVVRHIKEARGNEGGGHILPSEIFDRKKMRVKSISDKNAKMTTFRLTNPANGTKEVSVDEYFKDRYGIHLKYPNLPLIHTQRDGDFPIELCFTAEGERYKEPLQGAETADFIKVCTAPATIRVRQIREHLARLQWHKQQPLCELGISVDTSMLKVKASLQPIPLPVYKHGSETKHPINGLWNLRGKVLVSPAEFQSWGVLYFPGKVRVSENRILDFCRELMRGCSQYGLGVPKQKPVMLLGNSEGEMSRMIQDLSQKVCAVFSVSRPHLLLFLVHQGENPALYRGIKNVCELQGIPSQVMLVERSVLSTKGQAQYVANITLKVNVKLGGINHVISEKLFDRPIMMIGADISHPSPSELRRTSPPPSYAAVVGSYDRSCVQFTAVTVAQATSEPIITSLEVLVTELFNRFYKRHNTLPERVIYWRDGLSDSETAAFMQQELKAFDNIRKKKEVKFRVTAINCVKRHHTRFFPDVNGRGDKLGNVLPGTVVENSAKNNDFYCVSQAALQGCCVPTHYISLHDENNISPADLQRLVVNGCTSYQRATRTVKVVPAVYYAHQVAERAKMHLRDEDGRTVLRDVGVDLAYTMYWQ